MVSTEQQTAEREIVVLVGPPSNVRTTVAQRLIDEGQSVVLCAGPPACPLVRQERCALVDVADAVVFMPRSKSGNRRIETALGMCADAAACAVVIDDTPGSQWPHHAIKVDEDDLDGVARGLEWPAF